MTTTDAGTIPTSDYTERGLAHLWLQTQSLDELSKEGQYTVITGGEGIYLHDSDGTRYIDAMSGLWVVAVGHGRAELAEVAREQMERLAFANPFVYATPSAIDLAAKLAELAPGDLSRSFFVNSGSEAVDTAIRMAKQWQYNRGEAKRFKVISRVGSYHGTTYAALSVNNSKGMNRVPFEPLMPGALKMSGEVETLDGIGQLEALIEAENPATIAALIAEPISTSNGSRMPHPDYWPSLRRICDQHGIVLIADEVINGFGRTGRWFAMEHFGVTPDLTTVAKQISSGYAPIAAVLASEKMAEGFRGDPKRAFMGGTTFGANPVSCAVALANLGIIERENLVENTQRTGGYLADQLAELKSRHASVARVNGVGFMYAIDLMRDPEAGVEFTDDDGLRQRMPKLLMENGLLMRAGATIQVAPPLVINREEVDELVDGLDRAIGQLESDLQIA